MSNEIALSKISPKLGMINLSVYFKNLIPGWSLEVFSRILLLLSGKELLLLSGKERGIENEFLKSDSMPEGVSEVINMFSEGSEYMHMINKYLFNNWLSPF